MSVWGIVIIVVMSILGSVIGFFNGKKSASREVVSKGIERICYSYLRDKFLKEDIIIDDDNYTSRSGGTSDRGNG